MSLLKKAHLGEVSVTVWPKVLKEGAQGHVPAEAHQCPRIGGVYPTPGEW
jgi:hypothetical protein